ncbi:large ribosomal subunit protein mL62-like [Diadema antillarum]|uniref:large ribosomal subunit protein mL62-like n=1 Tax=Diadema antillarum TaxID=105358 RepID=UPI003A8C13F8
MMMRRAGCLLLRHRHFATCQYPLNCGNFQSSYSLEKLYPQSNPDVTIPLRESHENAGSSGKFTGHIPVDRLSIRYSRSGGPGGQNVNKVESKVDVRFAVLTAEWLPTKVREKLGEQQKTRINNKGELIVTSERTRSRIRNFSDCLQKIRDMIAEAEREPKPPSEKDEAVRRIRVERMNRERLREKRLHSATKQDRRVSIDD